MQQYLDLVDDTLSTGTYKPNRTGVDTIATFSGQYTVDLSEGSRSSRPRRWTATAGTR